MLLFALDLIGCLCGGQLCIVMNKEGRVPRASKNLSQRIHIATANGVHRKTSFLVSWGNRIKNTTPSDSGWGEWVGTFLGGS